MNTFSHKIYVSIRIHVRPLLLLTTMILTTMILVSTHLAASDGVQIIVEDITYPETHTKMGYYIAEIGKKDPAPYATLAGDYILLDHYAWLWGSAEYTFPIKTREVDVWFFGSDYNDGVADFYVDGVYVGSFNTRWPPATEGWPNPPKNWFIRIVNLPLGEHTLKVICSDPSLGCLSIDALGVPLPVGGYLEPTNQNKIPEPFLLLVGLAGAISIILAVRGRHKA